MSRRAAGIAVVAVTVTAATAITALGTPAATDAVTTARGAPSAADGRSPLAVPLGRHTITLITGDTVVVRQATTGPPTVTVRRGPGRSGIHVVTRSGSDGHLRVLPSDAWPLVGSGRLDARLFDVTRLIGWRYDDRHRADIPLIAERRAGQATASIRGAQVVGPLPAAGMDGISVAKTRAATVWRGLTGGGARTQGLGDGIGRLWLDGRVRATAFPTAARPGALPVPAGATAPAGVRAATAPTGKGVTVAVLDTGIDATHPDLRNKVVAAKDFAKSGGAADKAGHGTHVASIIAGTGAASDGAYKGVATEARLANGKVLNDDGEGQESWIIAGMQWAATQVKAKIVNLSLGGPDDAGLDPVEKAIGTLSARHHTLFVVAAGNAGPFPRSVGSPGSAEAALTVGAVDRAGELAAFSSTGPRRGDYAVKPDITAPGVDIVAARPPGNELGEPVGPHYQKLSGTSMATPHVAGTAALLAQSHPSWTGARVKAVLMSTARPNARLGGFEQGSGQVDAKRAADQPVTATVGGFNTWLRYPHSPGRRTTRRITYHNRGAAPVTLGLTATVRNRTGPVAGRGPFVPSSDRLTVPANGSASVDVTVTADGVRPDAYGGLLTARSADGTIVTGTVLGAYVEPPAADLTVTVRNRSGKVVPALVSLDNIANGDSDALLTAPEGTGRIHLPAGMYSFYTAIRDGGAIITMHLPWRVDPGRRSLTFDARKAVAVRHTVDEPTAEPMGLDVSTAYNTPGFGVEYTTVNFDPSRWTTYVLPVRGRRLSYIARSEFLKKGLKEGQIGPYLFSLADCRTGAVPQRPAYRGRKAALAEIQEVHRGQGRATTGALQISSWSPGGDFALGFDFPVRLPASFTHYLTPNHQVAWERVLTYGGEEQPVTLDDKRTFERRRYGRELWNSAVTGPSGDPSIAGRDGDRIGFDPDLPTDGPVGLYSDTAPGHRGTDYSATGTVTLSSGDRQIAKTGLYDFEATLPPERARYRLDLSATRKRPITGLSTRIAATWTFTSGHTRPGARTPLPLPAVRLTPQGLDDLNRARAVRPVVMKVRVDRDPAASAGTVRTVTVEASFDRGRTWRPLALRPVGGRWTTTLTGPATATTVALRASAADSEGNTVRQTVLDAFLLTR